ncbi:unnamed protein product [Adineta steineri]|uniref:Uncharacterized protein n=1 Tax=Adineta steineri TaxID=433720 RepID=A0A814SG48_9BILA|nr:unnamed protein product [Adineta steineri]CAF4197016.1 unnamed protein product [Adineta steineri]
MYKRQQNGSYSEYARLKANCAFILPDLKPELYHDFRVFTKNKYGDNYERSYSIKVGKPKVDMIPKKVPIYWPYLALFVIGACLGLLVLIYCSCHKMRKSMLNKRETTENFERRFSNKSSI